MVETGHISHNGFLIRTSSVHNVYKVVRVGGLWGEIKVTKANTQKLCHMTTRFTTRHGHTQETGKHRDKQSRLPDVKDSDYSQRSRALMRSSNDETRTQTILKMALFCLLLQHKNMLDSRAANKIWKILKVAEKGSWLINSSGWTDHNGPPLSWFAASEDSSVFTSIC